MPAHQTVDADREWLPRQPHSAHPAGTLVGEVPKEDKEKKMIEREQYTPGPASGAQVRKDGEKKWTLILVRELLHPSEKSGQARTDPARLRNRVTFEVAIDLVP